MKTRTRGRGGNSNYEKYMGMEENTMVILDTSGSATLQQLLDDKLAFLEAVRSSSLVPEKATVPTNKMFEAIFQILKDGDSLDLLMGSFILLHELNKRYSRVHLSKAEKSGSSSPSKVLSEIIVVEEVWSPFVTGVDDEEANRNSGGSIDPLGFYSLIEDISERGNGKRCEAVNAKPLKKLLLLQYLVIVLEGDFFPRNNTCKENMNWNLLRESILSVILGSRKVIYKTLIKLCLSVVCDFSRDETKSNQDSSNTEDSPIELLEACDAAVELTLPEVEKKTCIALKKLLVMIMELDSSRYVADMHGLTTRVDGVRTPAAEIILDELTYHNHLIPPFFLVFDEPKWKLKLIVQYFHKYIHKSSVRTRRSNGSVNDETFDGILKWLSNGNNAKSIIKKMGSEVARLLLAHAFQAYLSLPSEHSAGKFSDSKEDVEGSCLVETCKNILSAFSCLKRGDIMISHLLGEQCSLMRVQSHTSAIYFPLEEKQLMHFYILPQRLL